MRSRRFLLLFACGLAGCNSDKTEGVLTRPDDASLVGTWAKAPFTLTPEVVKTLSPLTYFPFDTLKFSTSLQLNADGSFAQIVRQTAPSGAERGLDAIEGTFTVRGDSLFLHTTTARGWNRSYNGGVGYFESSSFNPFYGGAHISFRNDSLLVQYPGPPDSGGDAVEVYGRVLNPAASTP